MAPAAANSSPSAPKNARHQDEICFDDEVCTMIDQAAHILNAMKMIAQDLKTLRQQLVSNFADIDRKIGRLMSMVNLLMTEFQKDDQF